MKVWIGGSIVDGHAARVHVTDHGLLYGDGVFEGMRVMGGEVFRLHEHLGRLMLGAKALMLTPPKGVDEIESVVRATVRAHGESEAYIRLLLTRGPGPLGVDPTSCPEATLVCIVSAIKLFSDEQRERGLDLITSTYRRPTADVLDARVKTLNYLGSVLAKQEARLRGADDALVLNPRGHVAEASVANVFVVQDRSLYTPPGTDGCLEGITRRAIMQLAHEHGFDVVEKTLGRHDLFAADEVFLTGSGAGVITARSLDGRVLGSGRRGPVCEMLAAEHRALAFAEGGR
jgi:branched-chain amino acid aminotransferase